MTQKTVKFQDLEPQSVRLEWKGRKFLLSEATEGAYSRYENAISLATRYDPVTGRKIGYDNLGDSDAVLVAGCLREVNVVSGQESLAEMTVDQIRALPHRIVTWCFDWVKTLADLGPEDVPGESPPAGPSTSV